ncbi:hemerythrin domain-containing protein [Rhizobium bangladeshense]|uniref:hemerythrin domain-containing protein n=1 Tax=Rhizobium bangladeshense TaxID=1138189 RepID=UPI001FE272B5|nr:hemerythrin domain-containing protein [Rhizobium bangladeshense]
MASPRLSNEELLALEAEHRALADVVDDIGTMADRIARLPWERAKDELERLDCCLRDRLLPHERRDEQVYERLRRKYAAPDILAGMSRTHMEMQRQIHNLTVMRKTFESGTPTQAQLYEVQRLLHGLEAITRLHFARRKRFTVRWRSNECLLPCPHLLLGCRAQQWCVSLIVLDHRFDQRDAEDSGQHENEYDQQKVIDDKPSQPSSNGEMIHGIPPIARGESMATMVFMALLRSIREPQSEAR